MYIEAYELRRQVNSLGQTTPSFEMFVTSVGVLSLVKLRWPIKDNFHKVIKCFIYSNET